MIWPIKLRGQKTIRGHQDPQRLPSEEMNGLATTVLLWTGLQGRPSVRAPRMVCHLTSSPLTAPRESCLVPSDQVSNLRSNNHLLNQTTYRQVRWGAVTSRQINRKLLRQAQPHLTTWTCSTQTRRTSRRMHHMVLMAPSLTCGRQKHWSPQGME